VLTPEKNRGFCVAKPVVESLSNVVGSLVNRPGAVHGLGETDFVTSCWWSELLLANGHSPGPLTDPIPPRVWVPLC
jgi:hypothetical protein